jgi:hypothetical protein
MYIETPKVACTTIKSILHKLELEDVTIFGNGYTNWHDRSVSPLLSPIQIGDVKKFISRDDIYKFCFIRNPYSRLLSVYLNKIVCNKPPKRIILQQLGYNLNEIERELSFSEFVDAVVDQPIMFMNLHWRLQYYQTFQTAISYDYIGRLESFDKDIEVVLSNISQDYRLYLGTENDHATNATSLLQDYYTKSLANKVYNKYKIDFEYFNYSKSILISSPI